MTSAAPPTGTPRSGARWLVKCLAALAFAVLCLRSSGWATAILAGVFALGCALASEGRESILTSRLGIRSLRLLGAVSFVGCFAALVLQSFEARRIGLATAMGLAVALLLLCASMGGGRVARVFFAFVTAGFAVFHVILRAQPGSGRWTSDPALAIAHTTFRGEYIHYSPFWSYDALAAVLWLALVNGTFAPAVSLLVPHGHPHRERRVRLALATGGVLLALCGSYGLVAHSRPATFARNIALLVRDERHRASTLHALRNVNRSHVVRTLGPLLDGSRSIVVVIGESTARDHWDLYGYPRPTNAPLAPWASQLSLYSDVITPHSNANAVLERVLTRADASPGAGKEAGAVDIVSLARDAGYEVSWISAHAAEDSNSVARAVSGGADERLFLGSVPGPGGSAGFIPDDALARALDRVLQHRRSRHIAFVHLTGAREPYCSTRDLAMAPGGGVMLPTAKAIFGIAADAVSVDCYDRAMIRASSALSALLEVASRRGVDTLLYFSDHGESPESRTGHDPGVHAAEHVHIPLFWWLAPRFWVNHPAAAAAVRSNRDKPVLATDLYDTLQDLLGAGTSRFDPERSLLREAYVSSPRILFGRFDYDRWSADADDLERVRANMRELARSQPDLYRRVWALKVDTLGKLRQAMQAFPGVELNLVFEDGEFSVNHPPAPKLGIKLREYLRVAARRRDLRLWFDLKLARSGAGDATAASALVALDEEYGIRGRCIVELPPDREHAALASALAARAWHVARYLPAREASAISSRSGPPTIAAFLQAERDYLTGSGFSYLSYDVEARDLATTFLRDPRAHRLERLTWDVSADSSARDFLHQLRGIEESVFLVHFRSAYDD